MPKWVGGCGVAVVMSCQNSNAALFTFINFHHVHIGPGPSVFWVWFSLTTQHNTAQHNTTHRDQGCSAGQLSWFSRYLSLNAAVSFQGGAPVFRSILTCESTAVSLPWLVGSSGVTWVHLPATAKGPVRKILPDLSFFYIGTSLIYCSQIDS